jgi:hypothetical protein
MGLVWGNEGKWERASARSEAVGALITMMQCGVRKPITTEIKKT